MAQDGFQHTPKSPKTAPRRAQVATGPPKDASEKPKSSQNLKNFRYVAFSPFRFRWPSETSRWLQEGAREPQAGPKRAPIRP